MKAVFMRAGIFGSMLAVSLFVAAPAYAADKECHVVHAAEVDMGSDELGGVVVPMNIGGTTVHLLVDTGGVLSMLTKKVDAQLGLPTSVMAYGRYLMMFGGHRIDRFSTAHDIDFGGLKTNSMKFAIMPDGWMPADIDGTIAPDILSAYDAEFDFANNKFYLNLQDHCPGKVVYWTASPYAIIPMHVEDGGHVNIDVELDGKKMTAGLDTGSTRSYLSFDTAQQLFGLNEKNADLKRLPDNTDSDHGYTYPFKALSLEGLTVERPDLILLPNSTSRIIGPGSTDMILGMGILRQLHLYIAYGEGKIYATGASAH